MAPRQINTAGLNLIKSFEQFVGHPYQDQVGVWTIGYGHTQGVTQGSPSITENDAENLLRQDLGVAEGAIGSHITVALGENQYAALVSLVFNTGAAPLTHTLGQKLNAGDYAGAADEFPAWRMAGGVVSNGLVRRRAAEQALFLAPDQAG